MSGQATVWIRPLGQTWQAVGTASDRGAYHENLQLVSDQAGPKSATFTLYRPPRGLFGDLLADTPVMVEVAGVRVWSGRISDAPEQSGAARQIDVTCDGWQAHLDDDAYERSYVHTGTTDFQDVRSILTADLTRHKAYGQVSNDNGIVVLMVPNGAAVATGECVGAVVDLGPGGACKRAVVTVDSSDNSGVLLYVIGTDTPYWNSGGANAEYYVSGVANNTFTTGTFRGSSTNGHRYITLLLQAAGTGTVPADDWFRIKTVQCFASTAYESGDASILTADTIIKDALTHCPLLSADRTGISNPGFAFPNFAPGGPQTPREVIAAALAPGGTTDPKVWRFKIDEYQRPVFQPVATVPVIDFGAWPGNESEGGSSNNAQGVATKVIVRGTGPDGTPVSETRTQSGTVVDRQGGVRAQVLDSQSYLLNTALADQLGDAYLAAHATSPFKGTVTVTPGGARRTIGGTPLHPAHLLLATSELARLTDLIDPDTGGIGRGVTIDQVTYRDDDLAADVALDNTRTDYEALQARLGLLVPS